MKIRIRYAQQIVGLFLIIALGSLVTILIFMGLNQRWFAHSYTFYSRFMSADNVTVGMSIKLKGFEIGKVSEVHLNNQNRVNVEIQIYDEFYDKIRPDSILELSVSPIGLGTGMNLWPGKNTLPSIEEYSFIPSTDTLFGKNLLLQGFVDKPATGDTITSAIAQVEPTLVEIRSAASGLAQLLGNLNNAVEGTQNNQITTILKDVHKSMGVIDDVLTTTSGNANGLMVQGKTLLDNANHISGDLARLSAQLQDSKGLIPKLLDPKGSLATFLDDKNQLYDQIYQIVAQVNQSMKEVRSLATYLNQSTPQISGILEDTRTTLKKTGDVMEGLSNNPLLKGGIPEQKKQPAVSGSLRDEDF